MDEESNAAGKIKKARINFALVPCVRKLSNKLMEDFLDFTRSEQGKKNRPENNY